MWAIPEVKKKVPIKRSRHREGEVRIRAKSNCSCHNRFLSQIASGYAPIQNRVASRMDLGLALVSEEHSRSTYHNSVRHSCDHSACFRRGTRKEAPITIPGAFGARQFAEAKPSRVCLRSWDQSLN